MSGERGVDEVEARVALARAALGEVTDPADVGELIDVGSPADGVADLRFSCTLGGYTGWAWTVSTAQIAGSEPTVLEVELLPMEGSLLAPPWVPWTERLAEWRRTHPADADGEYVDDDDPGDDDDLADDDLADDDLADDDLADDEVADDEVADGIDDDLLDDPDADPDADPDDSDPEDADPEDDDYEEGLREI